MATERNRAEAVDRAFAALSDGTRIDILRAMAEANEPMSFSALFEAVEYDTPSNFSYHLDKLTGRFVHKGADGYVLTWPGKRVVRTVILTGTTSDRGHIDDTDLDLSCPLCGGDVGLEYHQHVLSLICFDCQGVHDRIDRGKLFGFPLPPSGLTDRAPREILDAAVRFNLKRLTCFQHGICSNCTAGVISEVSVCRDHTTEASGLCGHCGRHHSTEIYYSCTHCGLGMYLPGTLSIAMSPAVRAFYQSVDPDFRPGGWTEFERALQMTTSVIDDDPVRLRFETTAEDRHLEIETDDRLEVIHTTERVRSTS